MTLEASLDVIDLANLADNVRTAEEWDYYHECRAEQEAEGAWLRHAESLGWEEEYLESLCRSGLRARPW